MKFVSPCRLVSRNVAWLRLAGLFGLSLFLAPSSRAQDSEENPFTFSPSIVASNGATFMAVNVHVPAHHHIYSDRLSFELNGAAVVAQLPPATKFPDKFNGGERLAFEQDFRALCPLPDSAAKGTTLTVNFQGCNESECFFPETRSWKINDDRSLTLLDDSGAVAQAASISGNLTNGFQIAARASGFMSSGKFLSFLDQSRNGTAAAGDELTGKLARLGLAATLGLILLGGLALNLTPCVLPMIPINLAILGAGARNQNRRRGFALGAVYGAGMAFAYGALGLVVVLTGSKFGALNSSAWFNFSIAALFIVLALAMFDKLAIDFSRFQRVGNQSRASHSAFLAAGVMGSVSALLAGACVAPVVISVLLLATTFYQNGNPFGLLLPFVLGLGMAIPWPFAAAGLSFLPKPGAWMTRVKYAFGVLIFGFALWYGWLGWNLAGFGRHSELVAAAKSNGVEELQSALARSRATGRPVVVDFWASWCKNCEAMEHSTFRNETVRRQLSENYILVRFQAERLSDPALKPVLDQFGVMGLPTCVVLRPESAPATRNL